MSLLTATVNVRAEEQPTGAWLITAECVSPTGQVLCTALALSWAMNAAAGHAVQAAFTAELDTLQWMASGAVAVMGDGTLVTIPGLYGGSGAESLRACWEAQRSM